MEDILRKLKQDLSGLFCGTLKEAGVFKYTLGQNLLDAGWRLTAFREEPKDPLCPGDAARFTVTHEVGSDAGVLVKVHSGKAEVGPIICTTLEQVTYHLDLFLEDQGFPEKEYDCVVHIECDYVTTIRASGRYPRAARDRAEEAGKHHDIDKMDQNWSEARVCIDDVVEVKDDGSQS